MRKASFSRKTNETEINIEINLDGSGEASIDTGIGFFDHMLNSFAKHSFYDLKVHSIGDLEVDCHHTIEDIAIVLGKVFNEALGNKEDIRRFGEANIPMEDALLLSSIDLSGRAFLNFEVDFTTEKLGDMSTEMIEEFFRAFCLYSGLNLHLIQITGKNNHHIAEACFKSFARALSEATSFDKRVKGVLSTKGILEV